MKTGEMYTKALIDPKASFRRLDNGKTYSFSDAGVMLVNGVCESNYTPRLNEDWELVREPVDFMTAAKALETGKHIRVEFSNCDRIYKTSFFQDDKRQPLTTTEVLYGKWYIE